MEQELHFIFSNWNIKFQTNNNSGKYTRRHSGERVFYSAANSHQESGKNSTPYNGHVKNDDGNISNQRYVNIRNKNFNGKPLLVLGNGPKDSVKNKFSAAEEKYIKPFVDYEWGKREIIL